MLPSLKCNFQGVKETEEETVKQRASNKVEDKRVDRIFKQHRSIREKGKAIAGAKETGKKKGNVANSPIHQIKKNRMKNEILNLSVSIQKRGESTSSDTD